MLTETPGAGKQHYYLFTGELTFIDGEMNTGITRMNTVLVNDKSQIRVKNIGRANQALGISLIKKLNDERVQLLDCVVLNIIYLGHMTEKDFYKDMPTEQAIPVSVQ